MKASRVYLLVICVLVIVVGKWLFWPCVCGNKHHVDLYLGPDGHVYTHAMGPEAIDPIFVFPGDDVVWNNPTDNDISLSFSESDWFGVSTLTVPAGKREILRLSDGADGSVNITGGDGSGSPAMKVGDGP